MLVSRGSFLRCAALGFLPFSKGTAPHLNFAFHLVKTHQRELVSIRVFEAAENPSPRRFLGRNAKPHAAL